MIKDDVAYTSQGSPEKQSHSRMYRDIQKEIYYEGSTHTTMESGKSVICKLEAQESQWCSSSPNSKV